MLITLIAAFYRTILKTRYRITVQGAENLTKTGPFLVLPNHVALVDPQIIMAYLNKYIKVGPVMSRIYYDIPGLTWFFKSLGTVPIGDLESGKVTESEIREIFSTITDHLKENKNILIYPAGQIAAQGYESIIGKQAVYNIVRLMPENTRVIGIKIRGLWGSRWSKAWHGKVPNLVLTLFYALWLILSNAIFFAPKRDVTIEIDDITDLVRGKLENNNEFNRTLEHFYNSSGEEPIQYISHYFYFDSVKDKKPPEVIRGSVIELSKTSKIDPKTIPDDVKNVIIDKVSTMKDIPALSLTIDSRLIIDCLCDSLDLAELKSFVSQVFPKSSNPSILELKTIGNLCQMALGKMTNEALKPCEWGAPKENTLLINKIRELSEGSTILDGISNILSTHRNTPWAYDQLLGMQTYGDMYLKATILAQKIKKHIPGDHVGIMLPSLTLSTIALVAVYLSGKTPVMMNWTLPKTAFEHCIEFANLTSIITSSNFFDKVKNEALEGQKDKMVFLEDWLKNLTFFEKISGLIRSKFAPSKNKSSVAVLLFTSGSENLPKAVPLTHANILADLRGALEVFPVTSEEIFLGFLPPFHSFGFTTCVILPLISGLRIVHTPDPNDAGTILSLLKHTKATTFPATPTFLKMILNISHGADLDHVHFAMVGAEKCPQEVFDTFMRLAPHGVILEGYGITECSPVVSINPPDKPKHGSVGLPIKGLDLRILDLATGVDTKTGEQGMIYVQGESIFGGYLDPKIDSPFETIDGQSYYKTGDLGYLDQDGYLFITGRLKRFVKIAGEMISLPFIENILLEKYGNPEALTLAVEALEHEGTTKIVAFSTESQNLDEMNEYLRSKGVSNLARIQEARLIEAIPVLGTGKTDYKALKNMI